MTTRKAPHSKILIDSVYRSNENYYSQVLLEVCRYMVKDITIKIWIAKNFDFDFDSVCNFDDESI